MIRSHYPDVRIDKEAEALLSDGHKVVFLAWDRRKINSDVNSNYKVRTMKLQVDAGSIKVAIFLPIWWLYIIYQLIIIDFDIIHAADFDTYVPALFISKLKRKKIVYDIFDYYSDMIVFPIFPKISKFIFSKTDNFLMRFANTIIIADESRIKQIGSSVNKNIISIYNSPVEKISYQDSLKLNKNSKFTIFFGGVVQEDKGIINMISAIINLPNVELVIKGYCGTKEFEKKLLNICKDLDNVHLSLGWVPYDDIIKNTMKADMLFTLYDTNIYNNIYASPNKLFESMMYGKPIIVNEGTTMADIVKRENCGIVVPYNSIEVIKEAVLKLQSDEYLRKEFGENGRRAYEKRYNWSIMKNKLITIYS